MFCPSCRAEYQDGVSRCRECEVDLVDELDPMPRHGYEWRESSVVLVTTDLAALIVAKSVLESAGIPVISVNERAQDLFGFGRAGLGFSPAIGPARLEVPREYRKWARRILKPLSQVGAQSALGGADGE